MIELKRRSHPPRGILALAMALGFCATSAQAQIRIYRTLPVLDPSSRYTVEIRQGSGSWQASPTYQIDPNAPDVKTVADHFSSFGFDPSGGAAEVRIRLKSGVALTASNATLGNRMTPEVSVSHTDGAMILRVPRDRRHLYVKVDGQVGHPLMVFADPYQDTPIPKTAKVHTFAASNQAYEQTAQYDRFTVPNDVDAVVIEDGALVHGTIHTASGRTKPLLLTGRGMVLGRGAVLHGSTNIPYNSVVITKGNRHRVENIMVVNSRHFGIDVGDSAVLQNTKMYGYDANNDGVVGGEGSRILDNFFKVNDDHVKLYNNGMVVRNSTFWGQTNGGILQFGWYGQGGADNILVDSADVIEYEIGYCGDPALGNGGIARTLFSLRDQSKNTSSRSVNVQIRNIVVQGQLQRLVGLNGKYEGSYPIAFSNTVLENIQVLNRPKQQSWVYTSNAGEGYTVDLKFRNVRVGGACLAASDFKTQGDVRLDFSCGTTTSTPSLAPRLGTRSEALGFTPLLDYSGRTISGRSLRD